MYITSAHAKKPAYRPGLDRFSLYKTIWRRHWRGFLAAYPDRFEATFGPLGESAAGEIHRLLACGDYKNGFKKHACPECGAVLIVPFTCKSRLCLSCYRKKIYGWSIHLSHLMDTSCAHFHVTFTLPGSVRERLFERGFRCEEMIKAAARTYWRELRRSAGCEDREWRAGIMATVHRCGNALNYNPHVHLIGTRELVNVGTGEIRRGGFFHYRRIRFLWMDAACRLFARQGMFSGEEIAGIKKRFTNGFHVHFKPVAGEGNDVLYRTAEYLACGYFHGSQVLKVDNRRMEVTFRYKSWLDIRTQEKSYSTVTMDMYEFMARMLYFLPARHRKMIRYYGLYAHGAGEKLEKMRRATWADAVLRSFNTDPRQCPDCGGTMVTETVFSRLSEKEWRTLWKTHRLYRGYFRRIRAP